MSKYVAVNGKTEDGKDQFLINPLQWTTNLKWAFKWDAKFQAETDIRAMKKVYGMDAKIIRIANLDLQEINHGYDLEACVKCEKENIKRKGVIQ